MTRLCPLSQTDIKRAINAARGAGLDVTGVKINWQAGQIELTTVRAGMGSGQGQGQEAGQGVDGLQGEDFAL